VKFLLIVFIFAFLIMLWRKGQATQAKPQKSRPAAPTLMVACAHCGTHLPSDDALAGRHGVYCSAAHRATSEP